MTVLNATIDRQPSPLSGPGQFYAPNGVNTPGHRGPTAFSVESASRAEDRGRRACCVTGFGQNYGWVRVTEAFVVGAGVFAGTTYWLGESVKRWVAHARVSSDPAVWNGKATQVYDVCYTGAGCNECDDPNWAYNQCQITTKFNVTGVLCDANQIWDFVINVPGACSQALGAILQQQALQGAQQDARNKWALVILTGAAGLVAGGLTYYGATCLGAALERRMERLQEQAR